MLRRRRGLVCEEAVALVTDYLEGALSRREHVRFEAHLAGCPHCTEYLAQIKVTIDMLGHVEPDDLEPEVLDELVLLFRRWKAEES